MDAEGPAGFASFWDGLDAELAGQPARPVTEVLPRHSSESFTVFALRLTSIGPRRIFGFLSVPVGEGPFPALLETPRYGSVNNPPHWNDRLRYVVLTIMHRGQRLADQPVAASYPGLLTEGIETPGRYVYRAILADCLRAAEFLSSLEMVDPDRVAARGNDLALVTAARRPGIGSVDLESAFFYRLFESRLLSGEYPIEELNDHLRLAPDAEAAVARTLQLFDPLHHAADGRAAVLIGIGDGPLDGREWFAPLVAALDGRAETYPVSYRGGVDTDRRDAWLAGRLGCAAMSRFARDVR